MRALIQWSEITRWRWVESTEKRIIYVIQCWTASVLCDQTGGWGSTGGWSDLDGDTEEDTAGDPEPCWWSVVSPKANRFIVHHDLNKPLVSSLEQFSEAVPKFQPHLLVIGRLQMMDNFPFRAGQRLERIKKIRKIMETDSRWDGQLCWWESESLASTSRSCLTFSPCWARGRWWRWRIAARGLQWCWTWWGQCIRRCLVTCLGSTSTLSPTKLSAWVNTGAATVKASLTAHRYMWAELRVGDPGQPQPRRKWDKHQN